VIGGFHLLRATPDRVAKTVEALHALEPMMLAPLHCTGDQATAELSRAFGGRLHAAHVGSVFHFKSGHPTAP
jgi:7,8-dihydropterin-6-yl-methyl-4-(beta-D-ribofuranosyl)aminobenzene 5'-phosphate synthase